MTLDLGRETCDHGAARTGHALPKSQVLSPKSH